MKTSVCCGNPELSKAVNKMTLISCRVFVLLVLLFGCFSISNSSALVTRTTKQTSSLSLSGLESQNYYVNNLFKADQKNTDAFLQLVGKLLTERNEGFRSLNNSKISSAEAFLDVTNVAVDDNVNSVINLTVVFKARKDTPDGDKKFSNKNDKKISTTTEAKTPSPKSQSGKGQSDSKPNAFDKLVLETHNTYRKKHGVPPLTYSFKISKVSQDWANYLAEHNEWRHRPNGSYGENIYATVSSDRNYKVTGNKPVEAWYSEIKNYTFTQVEPSMEVINKTGHFTQLVWKNSKELGVGIAQSKKTRMYYVVCNYSPPGNFIGQFRKNVLPPKK